MNMKKLNNVLNKLNKEMKKLILCLGVVALLVSCSGKGTNTITVTGVDSIMSVDDLADSVAVAVIDSLDKTFVIEPVEKTDKE